MPVHSIEGKLGTGKTKFAVWMAQQAMMEGRRVASNVDLALEKLVPYKRKPEYVRLPDKPKAFDLEAAGHGNPASYEEDRNGIMILDELGTWLNARSFQDKDRAPMLDWLIHARKHGWDVYLIVQDANMIDKQVREALIEYQIRLFRGDKIRIPFLGAVLSLFNSKWGYMPKFHLATSRVGYGPNAIIAQRWWFKGEDLHDAYDTRQVFSPNYAHGSFTALPPWDYVPRKLPWADFFAFLHDFRHPKKLVRPPISPRHRAIDLIASLPNKDERIRLLKRWLESTHGNRKQGLVP